MNKSWIILVAVTLIFSGIYLYLDRKPRSPATSPASRIAESSPRKQSVVAENLDTPWEIVFLPDKSMLVTERKGTVRYIDPSGQLSSQPILEITDAREIGEGGLMGMALHPDFEKNGYVYLYYTYSGDENGTKNRVVRMTYDNTALSDEETIIDNIPGAQNHNGGRIAFGPDGYLYITTGDAQNPSLAQNTDSLAGKILRVTETGAPAPGNPFENLVYSYGHRNPQGLAWDARGQLWSTEHGRSGIQSGFDEVNLIRAGGNYGWPDIQGTETRGEMIAPVINSGSSDTWAPAGAAIVQDTLYFVGLRGRSLYEVSIQGESLGELSQLLNDEYGRLRVAALGPDNYLYIATSNKDGRGNPGETDDRIIKIPLK
ncbi:PQQ-dependent sugar dehydrogenase [Candidatus Roizmanbacteria bacterium]|nr:MAG: PQQ-dependent sugar dehydrogenase [Candidatus Roizmanbacteria bacterium]